MTRSQFLLSMMLLCVSGTLAFMIFLPQSRHGQRTPSLPVPGPAGVATREKKIPIRNSFQ